MKNAREHNWRAKRSSRASVAEQRYVELVAAGNVFSSAEFLPLIDGFLAKHPTYVPALRLKALVLDYAASQESETSTGRKDKDVRADEVQRCLDEAFGLEPRNTLVLADLGDFWVNQGEYERAHRFYNRAIRLIRGGEATRNGLEELEDVYQAKILAWYDEGKIKSAERCKLRAKRDRERLRRFGSDGNSVTQRP